MRVGQAALAALLLLVAARAEGQGQRRQRIPASAEWRIEGVAGRDAALVTGAGFHVGLIPSVRAGLSAATGVRFGEDGGRSASRGDLLVRFLLDPYRQSRYGISIGGGAALSNVQDGDWRPYLTGCGLHDRPHLRRGHRGHRHRQLRPEAV